MVGSTWPYVGSSAGTTRERLYGRMLPGAMMTPVRTSSPGNAACERRPIALGVIAWTTCAPLASAASPSTLSSRAVSSI